MRVATVHLDDGTNYQTDINGTDEEIRAYFVGRWLNFGVESDLMKQCTSVDIDEGGEA